MNHDSEYRSVPTIEVYRVRTVIVLSNTVHFKGTHNLIPRLLSLKRGHTSINQDSITVILNQLLI